MRRLIAAPLSHQLTTFGRVAIILQNRTEHSGNTEQLCMSSLQCLISMSCISLDRAQQAPHAGTHTAETWGLVLVLWPVLALRKLPPSCLCTQFFLDTRIRATRVPACIYPVICSLWRSDTEVRTYIVVPCFPSVPFLKIMTLFGSIWPKQRWYDLFPTPDIISPRWLHCPNWSNMAQSHGRLL